MFNSLINKKLSIRDGIFRKTVNGSEEILDKNFLDIVFKNIDKYPSRKCYKSAYNRDEIMIPVCWSNDGNTPDKKISNPPSLTCNLCPNSIKGSSYTGIGSQCKLVWKTKIVILKESASSILEFTVPAASAFGKEENGRYPLRPYVNMLKNYCVKPERIVTKVVFDKKATFPRVLFCPVNPISG
jgi:hypothetical protein